MADQMRHSMNNEELDGGNSGRNLYYSNIEILSMGTFTMLCVIGLIMNTLVIIAFSRFRLYRQPSNLQLFSLAIDDLGTAALVEPLVIMSYLKPSLFVHNPWLCRYFSSTLHIFPWGSTISILILSVTRVMIVLYPLAYRTIITCKHIYMALIGKYIILVGFVGVSNLFWITQFSMKYKQCFANYVNEMPGVTREVNGTPEILKTGIFTETLANKMTVPTLHLVGGLVIFIINAIVVVELLKLKMKKIVKGRIPQVVNAGVELILLVAVYMVTTISIPAIFLTDILGIEMSPYRVGLFSFIAKFLFYLQPILNPLVYVVRRPEYRFNMKRVITSLRRNDRNARNDRRFYRTAKVVMNTNRFINQVKLQQMKKAGGGGQQQDKYCGRRFYKSGRLVINTNNFISQLKVEQIKAGQAFQVELPPRAIDIEEILMGDIPKKRNYKQKQGIADQPKVATALDLLSKKKKKRRRKARRVSTI